VKNRRIAIAGLLLVASLGLTACTTAGTPTTPATTAPPTLSPTETLSAAAAKLKGQSYDVAVTQQGDATGKASVDSANNSASLQLSGTVEGATLSLSAIQIGTNFWVKVDLGALNSTVGLDATKWMLTDQSKITSKDAKPFDLAGSDALDIAGLLTSTSNVTRTDATHLSGTVDLTKSTGVSAPDNDDLTKAAALAKATPFTATVDDQGRLVDLKITPDAANSVLAQTFAFSNFGSPTKITAPAPGDVVPAPDFVYQLLNND